MVSIGSIIMNTVPTANNNPSPAWPSCSGRVPIIAVFVLGLILCVIEYKQTILQIADHSAYVDRTVPNKQASRIATYQEIGEAVNHSRHTLFWAPDYGHELEYYGQPSGQP